MAEITATRKKDRSISDRLLTAGYLHRRDARTGMDRRRTIYPEGREGHAVDRLNAKEAVEFLARINA